MWRPRMTLATLNEQFYRSSESTAHYFPTHFLSDYFLLSAYFLAVSCYKRMHLTSSAYGSCTHGFMAQLGSYFVWDDIFFDTHRWLTTNVCQLSARSPINFLSLLPLQRSSILFCLWVVANSCLVAQIMEYWNGIGNGQKIYRQSQAKCWWHHIESSFRCFGHRSVPTNRCTIIYLLQESSHQRPW